MRRIALTGGIACGKSLVAKFLNGLGVETIDADDIVHELIPDPAERKRIAAEVFADPEKRRALEARLHPLVRGRIEEFLGEEGEKGEGPRAETKGQGPRAKGEGPRAKAKGEGPRAKAKGEGPRAEAKGEEGPKTKDEGQTAGATDLCPSSFVFRPPASPGFRLAIIPLLFETHWDADYDIIVSVVSDRKTQVLRMVTTRGYSREEAEARLAAQMPVAEKAAKSHYVIENNGSAAELKEKVAQFVDWLKEKSRS